MGPTATATLRWRRRQRSRNPFEPITSSLTALRAAAGGRHREVYPGLDLDGDGRARRRGTSTGGQSGWLRQPDSRRPSRPPAQRPTRARRPAHRTRSIRRSTTRVGRRRCQTDSLALDQRFHCAWARHMAAEDLREGPEAAPQLFVDGIGTAQRRINIVPTASRRWHRRLVDCRLGRLAQTGKSHEWPRAPAGLLYGDVPAGRRTTLTCARMRKRHRSALGALRMGTARLGSRAPNPAAVAAAAERGTRSSYFAYDDGTRAATRGAQRPERWAAASGLAGRAHLGRRSRESERRRPS